MRNIEVEATAFIIFLSTWLREPEDFEDFSEGEIYSLYKKWTEVWIPALQQPHSKNCNRMRWNCHRCGAEQIYAAARKIVAAKYEEPTE